MMLMDGASVAAHQVLTQDREREAADRRRLTEAADNAARAQAWADHYAERDAAREAAMKATPRDSAYAAACADLDYRTKGAA